MPINPNSPAIAKKLNQALLITSNVFSEVQIQDIQIYINAGEWELALVTLCEFIDEEELPINSKVYGLFKDIEALIGSNYEILEYIKKYLID